MRYGELLVPEIVPVIDCDEEYIEESGRTFGERFKEHLKTPSPIFNHQNTSGHITSIDNFKIIGREENNVARSHVYQGQQPYPEQEHRKIQSPTHMG